MYNGHMTIIFVSVRNYFLFQKIKIQLSGWHLGTIENIVVNQLEKM